MKIKIYTTSTCHWCKTAKDYFKSKGIEYEEYNVEENHEKALEMLDISGQRSVPVIVINDKVIIGFDKDAIDTSINNK